MGKVAVLSNGFNPIIATCFENGGRDLQVFADICRI